jgi:phosphoglycolate phosphatase
MSIAVAALSVARAGWHLYPHIMPAPTIVFDLDGTLVDTAPDLIATLNTILAREGLPPVAFEAARNMVGGGARAMIERGLAAAACVPSAASGGGSPSLPSPARGGGLGWGTAEVERLCGQFIEHYAAHIADHSRPFPGVEVALDELARAGCRLAVCTNKLEWLSLRLLRALGLADRFAAICGADTFGVQKPAAAILHGTVARAGGHPDFAVMVGDSITDIAVARAAGMAVVAVDFGYSETPVAELGPDRIVSSFERLPAVVFALLAAKEDEFRQKVNR